MSAAARTVSTRSHGRETFGQNAAATARHTADTSLLVLDAEHGAVTVACDAAGRVALVDAPLGPRGTTLGSRADALGSALTLALCAGAPADVLLGRRVGGTQVPELRPTTADDAAPRFCAPALHAALTAPPTAACRLRRLGGPRSDGGAGWQDEKHFGTPVIRLPACRRLYMR